MSDHSKIPYVYLEVSYKKISPLPKHTALAERSYPNTVRAEDGYMLCRWILGASEVGKA